MSPEKLTSKENKPSHLNPGVKPIYASLEEIPKSPEEAWVKVMSTSELGPALNVNYGASAEESRERSFQNAGEHTYVISEIDPQNKFSRGFYSCTGLIVCGIDKSTGKNISFLTHQNDRVPIQNGIDFVNHLQQSFQKMKQKCVPGTIDAVIVGGSYVFPPKIQQYMWKNKQQDRYADMIKLLGQEVKSTLGFEPVIINGPKNSNAPEYEGDQIYFDTTERRLYFLRSNINRNAKDFTPNEFESEKKKFSTDV